MKESEVTLHEFVIGQQKSEDIKEEEDDSNVNIAYLITEPMVQVTLCSTKIENRILDNGQEVLNSISFNNGKFEFYARSGVKQKCGGGMLELGESPFFDCIELQQTRYFKPSKKKYSRRITYLRLEQGEQSVQIGSIKDESDSIQNLHIILPVEEVKEPCMISGVGLDDEGISFLQIISAIDCTTPKLIPPHLYSYVKSEIGVVMLDKVHARDALNEGDGFGAMNFEDPIDLDILRFVKRQYQYMKYGYAEKTQLLELYEVLGRTIYDDSENIIYSLFRLERHLRWRVFHCLEGKGYVDSDPLLRLKLYKVVQCLSLTVDKCKMIRDNKPSMNCYAIAFIHGNKTNIITAWLAILCQLCLTFVLLRSVLKDESSQSSFVLAESIYITPIVTLFSILLVWKQMSNSFALRRAYPEMGKSLMGIFEGIGNILIGLAVLVIQFIIVTRQDNRLEYVLNSVATIFIIELDDQAVFEDLDGISVLNRKYLTKSLKDRIEKFEKDPISEVKDWYAAKHKYQIDKVNCTLLELPESKLSSSPPERTKTDESDMSNMFFSASDGLELVANSSVLFGSPKTESPSPSFSPLLFSSFVMSEQSWANFNSANEWVEIMSKEVVEDINSDAARATLSFNWKDQGWGNQKGQLKVKLVKSKHDHDEIASFSIENCAPHYYETELIIKTFDSSHDILNKCSNGNAYVIEARVGGGGGHELYVKDIEFKIESI